MAIKRPTGNETPEASYPKFSYRTLAVGTPLLVVLAILFIVLTLESRHTSTLDSRVFNWVIGWRAGWLTPFVRAVTDLATAPVVFGLLVVINAAFAVRRSNWGIPLACGMWLAIGQLLRLIINVSIARPRPPVVAQLVHASGYSFPSGHTTTATLAYPMLGWLLSLLIPAWRNTLWTAAAGIAVAVGLSRVYLGVHWPTDVLGGWCLGLCWLLLGVGLVEAIRRARALSAPRQADQSGTRGT